MIPDLPASWCSARLGLSLKRRRDTVMPATLTTDFVNIVGLEDIQDGGRGGIAIKKIRPAAAESLKTRFYKGDILYGKLRPYLNKVAIAPDDGLCSTEIWAFEAESFADPYFVYAFLSSRAFVERVSGMTKGANLPRLDLDAFESVEIVVPPLSEQRQIVEILQDARAIRSLRQTAAEKAREILPALYHDRFSDRHNRGVIPLDNMADVVSGVALGRQIRGGGAREVCYLRVANVQAGYVDLAEIKTTKASEQETEAYSLQAGDILMTEGGDFDKLGRGCLWMGQVTPCIHQNHVFRVRPDPEHLNSHFFAQYLQSLEAKRYFLRCAKRTTNLASINLTQLKKLPVPNISLPEQLQFSREVDEVLQCLEIDGSDIGDSLEASLQAFAFSGRLTAEWRVRHKELLARETTDRDELLRSGARAGSSLVGTVVAKSGFLATFPLVTLGIQLSDISVINRGQSELSRDQHRILEQCKRNGQKKLEGTNPEKVEIKTFTAAEIAGALTGPLHDNIQAVESNLAVLVARGLVIALSLEQQTPDNETVYGNCYRLPVQDPVTDEEDGTQSSAGVDGARDQEILRLLGNRKREEKAP